MIASDRKLWQQAVQLIHSNHRIIPSKDRSEASFWLDTWTGTAPLKTYLTEDFSNKAATTVKDGLLSFLSYQVQSNTERQIAHCTFMSVVWEIWCSRNQARFREEKKSAKHIVNRTMLSVRAMCTSFKLHQLSQPWLRALRQNGYTHEHSKITAPTVVKWKHPPTGRLKLNIDGAFKSVTGEAGGGGILRDHEGTCVYAFAMNYQGAISALDAEARALRDGLTKCCNQGFLNIMVETDSQILKKIVTGQMIRP
ncbi:hypothetical protein Taro_040496 [Colocasia esculenta]|uniref:RNase H type-1 domain-containing protein n=1 Tax=Colocasia esculenta TaxID=4460 RepID=A0A843WT76_COLES|nr:hypothetical protein [Colocasia esculenta]